jgi:hypothetical protein
MADFLERSPTLDNYWRSIILFGRNVASYKFALAKSLLEFIERGDDLVTLESLAEPFSRHVCAHIKANPKQTTAASSTFLEACRSFNAGETSQDHLLNVTRRLGFNNVIDAFHVVNQKEITQRFFLDERSTSGGIRLTDNLFDLFEDRQSLSLDQEVEARWRLVETAWELGLSKGLIAVAYDQRTEQFTSDKGLRRISVTSARAALNGYQKGKCFHCFANISIATGDAELADVDHFFPHTVKSALPNFPVNGVWNLVLSCPTCNRGQDGKFARVPNLTLLSRLHRRNEFFIESHHPLRETLISQSGATPGLRASFLQARHDEAMSCLLHSWQPSSRGPEAF